MKIGFKKIQGLQNNGRLTEAKNLLLYVFDKDITNIKFVGSGEISKAFYFTSNNNNFVLRISHKREDFDKDRYAYENFRSINIPIPKIIKAGKSNSEKYYAVSERCKGNIIRNFDDPKIYKLLPKVLDTLFEINHKTKTNDNNYGLWDKKGRAKFLSWKEYLLEIKNDINLFDKFSKNQLLYINMYQKILNLVKYCPEERYLIHGDYGFNNLISNGKNITGVIDWGDSKYGDFVYDIAWLILWTSEIKYFHLFKNYYKNKKLPVENFKERINCYLNHIGISILLYFKKIKDYDSYDWVVKKLSKSTV